MNSNHNTDINYFKIGSFVLAGITIIILALIVFGSKHLFSPTVYVETYFNESVQGISEGTLVKYRGLQIGYVKEIAFVSEIYGKKIDYDSAVHNRAIYVKIAITSKLFTRQNSSKLEHFFRREVDSGLRVKITPQGLTGISYLELNYFDPNTNPLPKLKWQPQHYFIPSVPSVMAQLSDNLQSIFDKLKRVDFNQLFAKIEKVSDSVDRTATKTETILNQFDEPITNMLQNLKAVSDNLQVVSEQLKYHPSQMIFSKPPPLLDPRKL